MNTHDRSRTAAAAAATAVLLLGAAGPSPATAAVTVRDVGDAVDPLAPVLAFVTLLAWGLVGWLVAAVVTTAGGHLPGRSGRALAALARRSAPAAVRRTIEVTLGLTVAVGALTTPAAADPGPPEPAPAVAPPGLDWGGRSAGSPLQTAAVPAGRATAPDLDWASPTDSPPSPVGSRPAESIVVRPGDTLWDLAEADLQGRTGAAPADAQVAAAWPRWWAANRDAVGADPHLLHPGTRLTPPAGG